MVNIQLTENYKLTTDSRCWRVEKKQLVKGEESYTPVSYHGSAEQALKSAESRLVRDSNATTFAELLEACEKASQATRIPIDEAIKKFRAIAA